MSLRFLLNLSLWPSHDRVRVSQGILLLASRARLRALALPLTSAGIVGELASVRETTEGLVSLQHVDAFAFHDRLRVSFGLDSVAVASIASVVEGLNLRKTPSSRHWGCALDA